MFFFYMIVYSLPYNSHFDIDRDFQTEVPACFHRETNKKLSYQTKTWIINIVYFTVPSD